MKTVNTPADSHYCHVTRKSWRAGRPRQLTRLSVSSWADWVELTATMSWRPHNARLGVGKGGLDNRMRHIPAAGGKDTGVGEQGGKEEESFCFLLSAEITGGRYQISEILDKYFKYHTKLSMREILVFVIGATCAQFSKRITPNILYFQIIHNEYQILETRYQIIHIRYQIPETRYQATRYTVTRKE